MVIWSPIRRFIDVTSGDRSASSFSDLSLHRTTTRILTSPAELLSSVFSGAAFFALGRLSPGIALLDDPAEFETADEGRAILVEAGGGMAIDADRGSAVDLLDMLEVRKWCIAQDKVE